MDGSTLNESMEKVKSLEPSLTTLRTLLESGGITRDEVFHAGDWDMRVWGYSGKTFSVAALSRVRQDGAPFPEHQHEQKKWVLCSKGKVAVTYADGRVEVLRKGGHLIVLKRTLHSISAQTPECEILWVNIPPEPDLHDGTNA